MIACSQESATTWPISFGSVYAEHYFLLYTYIPIMELLLIIYVESKTKSSHQKYKLMSFTKMNFQMVAKNLQFEESSEHNQGSLKVVISVETYL